ncbi:MAG TPA: cytosine permease [Terriglobia bacterium]|nr:cytosine permease [Terriglobia bacterium]
MGIFLWVGFYLKLAAPTIGNASVSVCLWGLLVAGVLCFALYYYVPAMLGMKTGHPLYVVGSSTFGATGGYLIPGLLMGLLQLGWVAVVASVSAGFILAGLHQTSKVLFTVIVIIWVYSLAWVAIKGIRYVGQAAKYLNWIPLIMIVIVFWTNRGGVVHYTPPHKDSLAGFLGVLTIVIGYFATAGAAGADFGMNNRNRKDVVLGGVFGIVLGVVIAGGLPILSVAGYIGRGAGPPSYDYSAAISSVRALASIMFFLFAAASMVPTCFSSFIASNSFSTMLPQIPRGVSTLAGVTLSAILAITGVAANLVGFFTVVGASFGPICGAMAADYLFAGGRWSGPRRGINWAGYIAWAVGFLVGIPDHLPGVPAAWVRADDPAMLYSFIVGFFIYLALAAAGFRPPVIGKEEERPAAAVSSEV